MSELRQLCRRAVLVNGTTCQLRKAQEECAELVAEVNRFCEGRSSVLTLAEEVADVEITCMQLRVMIGDGAVDAAVRTKAERLSWNLDARERLRPSLTDVEAEEAAKAHALERAAAEPIKARDEGDDIPW